MARRKVADSSESVAVSIDAAPETIDAELFSRPEDDDPIDPVFRALRHFTDAATNRDYRPGDEIEGWDVDRIVRYGTGNSPLIGAFTE